MIQPSPLSTDTLQAFVRACCPNKPQQQADLPSSASPLPLAKIGVDDFLLHFDGGPDRLRSLIANAQLIPAEWPDLDIHPAYTPLPEFPIDAMPPVLGEMALEIVKAYQVPVETAALLLLSVVGLAAGGWYRIIIKSGVFARANLYALFFLGVAERKSTVYASVLGPVETWISLKKVAWDEAVKEDEIRQERIKELRKKLSDLKAKPDEIAAARNRLGDEEAKLSKMRSPLILDDESTVEFTACRMAETGGFVAKFSDDARQFMQILTGKYADGKCQDGLFIKAFDGSAPFRSGRRSRGTIEIQNPCIALCLMVQLDWLKKLGDVSDLAASGFISRNIICVPDPIAGTRDAHGNLRRAFSNYHVDPCIDGKYKDIIVRLLEQSYAMTQIKEQPIDRDAHSLWVVYYNAVEAQLGPDGTLQHLGDIAKRFPTQALRIALISSLCRNGTTVSKDDMDRGIRLVQYFAHHAERATQAMRSVTLPHNPDRIIGYVRRHQLREFVQVEIQRRVGGMDCDAVEDAVRWLVAHDYCRLIGVIVEGAGRKPSPRFAINPNLFGYGARQ